MGLLSFYVSNAGYIAIVMAIITVILIIVILVQSENTMWTIFGVASGVVTVVALAGWGYLNFTPGGIVMKVLNTSSTPDAPAAPAASSEPAGQFTPGPVSQ